MQNKPQILYVDDEPKNLTLMRQILQDTYQVISFPDGLKALESLERINPDLILLDIMMPFMDGYEVCRRLKTYDKTKEVPVIFVTARSEVEDETYGLQLGAVDYISKPVQKELLKIRIKNQLDLREKILVERKLAELKADVERITRHDLKTPLNAIINFPIFIRNEPLSETQEELLKEIEMAGQTMLGLVNLSLDLYKMEQGVYDLQPVSVDILSVLKDVLNNNMFIETTGKVVETKINGQLISKISVFTLQGERLLFYSMLSNLIKNAIDASIGKPISIFLDNINSPCITIHNHRAVPEHIKDTFFEKYVTYGKRGGTGLGTYSAKLIAETLGGTISMNSSEEHGTEVKIVFPFMCREK
ncbi:MAG: hybrid sensor histidine kinase/response regulator [Candidatus Magnetomorum sp.]|nr:hybrid sensor histidine kinase/response regulator [Candidatus Magnetomorum sp.]